MTLDGLHFGSKLLGRWTYCKYCYANARPAIGPDGSIVVCSRCGYGLAPMDGVLEAGSLKAWKAQKGIA